MTLYWIAIRVLYFESSSHFDPNFGYLSEIAKSKPFNRRSLTIFLVHFLPRSPTDFFLSISKVLRWIFYRAKITRFSPKMWNWMTKNRRIHSLWFSFGSIKPKIGSSWPNSDNSINRTSNWDIIWNKFIINERHFWSGRSLVRFSNRVLGLWT